MTSYGSAAVRYNGARVAHLPGQYGEVSQIDRASELQTDLEHYQLRGTRKCPHRELEENKNEAKKYE